VPSPVSPGSELSAVGRRRVVAVSVTAARRSGAGAAPRGGGRGAGPGRLAGEAGQAEVEDLDHARGRQHEVVRLDVAVHHAAGVRVLEPQGRLPGVVAGPRHRQRTLRGDDPVQRDARDVLHDQEVRLAGLLGVVGGHDVRVGQAGRGPDLLAEAAHRLGPAHQRGVDDLEGDQAVHQAVPRLVDRAHAARAQARQDLVARVVRQGGRDRRRGRPRAPGGRGGRRPGRRHPFGEGHIARGGVVWAASVVRASQGEGRVIHGLPSAARCRSRRGPAGPRRYTGPEQMSPNPPLCSNGTAWYANAVPPSGTVAP
jgi:hypothetical protein